MTDNNPLTYVTTTAKLDATGQRWMAALAGYNFSLRYRAGRNNADADGLSRLDMNTFLAVHESISACVEEAPLCYAAVQPDAISEAEELCRLAGMERFNQTLIQMMGTIDEEKKFDWKTHVVPMVHA